MADLDPALEEEPQAPIASEDTDTDEDGEAIKQAAHLRRSAQPCVLAPPPPPIPARGSLPSMPAPPPPLPPPAQPSAPAHTRAASGPASQPEQDSTSEAETQQGDRDGRPSRSRSSATDTSTSGRASKPLAGTKRAGSNISMKTLVDAGLLQPGGSVQLAYKGKSTTAELTAEGRIAFNGLVFDSPSAFSIYIKRLQNPTRKSDDGWKSIKYAGKLLETYKVQYTQQTSSSLLGGS